MKAPVTATFRDGLLFRFAIY